jgi:hypothetical protein
VNIQYIKTKKIAMVSSRDQYVLVHVRDTPANQSATGNRTVIVALKSYNSDAYPKIDGCVRADTIISGYYIEEIAPNKLDIHFMVESDFKVSLFIQK